MWEFLWGEGVAFRYPSQQVISEPDFVHRRDATKCKAIKPVTFSLSR